MQLSLHPFSGLADMSTSLRSNQWSCSELMRGATIAADLAGMDLRVDPSTLSPDELLLSIQDRELSLICMVITIN